MASLVVTVTIDENTMTDPKTGSSSTLKAVLTDAFWWKFGGDATAINITEDNPSGSTPTSSDKNNMLQTAVMNFFTGVLQDYTVAIYAGEGINTGVEEAQSQTINVALT